MRENCLTGSRLIEVIELEHAVFFDEYPGVYAPWRFDYDADCPAVVDKRRKMLFVAWYGLPDQQVVLAGAIARRYEIAPENVHLVISPKDFRAIIEDIDPNASEDEDHFSIVVHAEGIQTLLRISGEDSVSVRCYHGVGIADAVIAQAPAIDQKLPDGDILDQLIGYQWTKKRNETTSAPSSVCGV